MKKLLFPIAAALALGLACGEDSADDNTPIQEVVLPTELAADVQDALDTAIQGEYKNEETYRGVTQDFGNIQPFFRIISAEVQHSEALAALYEIRGLAVPQNPFNNDNVTHYESPEEACQASVEFEEETVARYNTWLTLDLPPDVALVFTRLRDASLNNHLPAFERCS